MSDYKNAVNSPSIHTNPTSEELPLISIQFKFSIYIYDKSCKFHLTQEHSNN